jgi:hypothetical protein
MERVITKFGVALTGTCNSVSKLTAKPRRITRRVRACLSDVNSPGSSVFVLLCENMLAIAGRLKQLFAHRTFLRAKINFQIRINMEKHKRKPSRHHA